MSDIYKKILKALNPNSERDVFGRFEVTRELRKLGYTKFGAKLLTKDFLKWGKKYKLISSDKERGVYCFLNSNLKKIIW